MVYMYKSVCICISKCMSVSNFNLYASSKRNAKTCSLFRRLLDCVHVRRSPNRFV